MPFYRDALGLPAERCATVADQGVRVALLPMHDGEIELLEPTDPAGGMARFLERKGEGLHHLCFETPDVSAALAHAKAAGLPLIDPSPRPGLAGMIAFLHPKASHGVLIEFAQPLTPTTHPEPSSASIQARGIGTVYIVVKNLAAAAATYARNFQCTVGPVQDHPHFGAKHVPVSIPPGRMARTSSCAPAHPTHRPVRPPTD